MPSNGGIIGPLNVPDQDGNTKITSLTSSGNFTVSPNNSLSTATVFAGLCREPALGARDRRSCGCVCERASVDARNREANAM